MIKLANLIENEELCPMQLLQKIEISSNLQYHIEKQIPLSENIFRTYSESYFELLEEVRTLYFNNQIELCDPDAELVESDLGKKELFEGREVYLDAPIEVEEDLLMELKHRGRTVHLSRPFRTPGGPKKYAVYVKSKNGKVKKVTFGDPNLSVKRSAARRKSFAARHKCSQKKDRTTAGYWSCRSHRMRSLGNKGKGKYW